MKTKHIGAYIPETLERQVRISAATFGISKSEFIKVAVEFLTSLKEDELRIIYDNSKQKEKQNDHSSSS